MNVYVREVARHLGRLGLEVDVFTRSQTPGVPTVVPLGPGARVIHVEAGPQRPVPPPDIVPHLGQFTDEVMAYFRKRLVQAPRDAGFALRYVREHARTPAERQAVCDALTFKTDVLWVQLDALQHAYVEGNIPPGAFGYAGSG